MEPSEFYRVVSLFADGPDQFSREQDGFVVSVGGHLITGKLERKEYVLQVSEDGFCLPAERWVVDRLGQIRALASRVSDGILSSEEWFVAPAAIVSRDENTEGAERELQSGDAAKALDDLLAESQAGASRVVYITSDAGEGKTTLIEHASRRTALSLLSNQARGLILPVALAGRPFLRFDDVVVGALVNRFRFLGLHYQSFLELVRLGAIIPAFDGFEEMFVESSTGEAVSALGTLVKDLKGDGTVIIAARKAYFEYHRLDAQVKLFDALGETNVSFSKLHLKRWDRERFVSYGEKRAFTREEADRVYDCVARRLDMEHPLLTRAVLVRRVFDIAENDPQLESVLGRVEDGPQGYFVQFVRGILHREATQKWIDRSGANPLPLLTVEQHEKLLEGLAREMWIARSGSLGHDVLELVVQLLGEAEALPVGVVRQSMERVKDHALLTVEPGGVKKVRFDHEEFERFFVGRAIAHAVLGDSESVVRNLLSRGTLPRDSVVACTHVLATQPLVWANLRDRLQKLTSGEAMASFVRENVGALLIGAMDGQQEGGLLSGLAFPVDALRGRKIANTKFVDCTFQSTTLVDSKLDGVELLNCNVEELDLEGATEGHSVVLAGATRVHAMAVPEAEFSEYAPDAIAHRLTRIGWKQQSEERKRPELDVEADPKMSVLGRVLRGFIRASELNEHSLENRLGASSAEFFNDMLPELIARGVLVEVKYQGRGNQRRYRLARRLADLQTAIEQSDGRFDAFLDRASP